MFEIRQTRPHELREALALALELPGANRFQVRAQVDAYLKYVQDRPASADAQFVAVIAGNIVAAGFCIDSPGRTALILLPSMQVFPDRHDVVTALMVRLVQAGVQRGMRLFQMLVPPGCPEDQRLLTAAGFEFMAELIYLERPATLPCRAAPEPQDVRWITYSGKTHDLFARTLEATYANSLDCPRLHGLRDVEDIIAGHKDAGVFKPEHWFVVAVGDEPVGCLLLARVKTRSAMELVYMGLKPEARGRGLASAMLRRTIQVALSDRAAYVTLAVDAHNVPARRLYEGFRFAETMRRSAWILRPRSNG